MNIDMKDFSVALVDREICVKICDGDGFRLARPFFVGGQSQQHFSTSVIEEELSKHHELVVEIPFHDIPQLYHRQNRLENRMVQIRTTRIKSGRVWILFTGFSAKFARNFFPTMQLEIC